MNGFVEFLSGLLGPYIPITYNLEGNSVIPSGLAGVDWPYIIRAVVFIVVLWSILRILGGMLCRT